MPPMDGTIIDAAVRFARSNPEVMRYARIAAPRTGRSVDDLLRDAIDRLREERERDDPCAQRAG